GSALAAPGTGSGPTALWFLARIRWPRLELLPRGFHAVDIELAPTRAAADLVRPRLAAKAGLCGLRERPERKRLGSFQRLGVEMSPGFFLEPDAEARAVEAPTRRDITDDGTEARDWSRPARAVFGRPESRVRFTRSPERAVALRLRAAHVRQRTPRCA